MKGAASEEVTAAPVQNALSTFPQGRKRPGKLQKESVILH